MSTKSSAAHGASMRDVVQTTTYITDISGLARVNEVRARRFPEQAPTSTTVEVSGLARPELMVEIEAVAAIVNGLEYINSHGGSVLAENDPSKVVIDSPESLAGLQMERSMLEDRIAPQAVANYTEQESQATFLRGDAVCLQHALPGQHRAAIGGNGANA